ncbi:CirA Outer membrane receptor proteins, mostly Fe transport [Methylophilaceae bacterium]
MSHHFKIKKLSIQLVLAGLVGGALPVMAEDAIQIAPVVVTGTRIEQNSFDLPMSIDSIDAERIQEGQLQVGISESLVRVPGVVALARGHYAQDVQISTRGFGARSAFGVRGIRLYSDGIPLTMPDGQGQAGTFDLGSAKSIEVLRGPFSALYGNSSGGVVQIFTADGPVDPTVNTSYTTGSYGTDRESIKVGGTNGSFNYNVDYSHLESDGYRDHSAVRKDLLNAKLGFQLNEDTRLSVLATYMNQPLTQDPQGLSYSAFQSDPTQTVTKSNTFNTRVVRSQSQVGGKLEHDFDSNNTASIMAYVGVRDNLQYQSVGANVLSSSVPTKRANGITTSTLATGTALTLKPSSAFYYGDIISSAEVINGNAGGVVEIARDFWGTDLRYTHKGLLADTPYSISVGTNFDSMTDARTSYDNFTVNAGTTILHNTISSLTYLCGTEVTCGVKGLLRRDEDNTAWNFDQYAQAEWSPIARLNLVAGMRHNNVHLKSEDKFLINGDGSGSASFSKTTPVVGALFKVNDMMNVYANAGKGFETPSLVEVAYLPDGSGGFNTNIKPATSNNYEIGTKAFIGSNTRATLALFRTDAKNEIVVAESVSGRASYQNAGGTSRRGFELTVDSDFGHGFAGYAAYAYLDAKYSDAFCSGVSSGTCPAANLVADGKAIPGAYKQTAYAELRWKHFASGFSTALEARAAGKVYVDDKKTEAAPGYAIASWRGGFAQNVRNWNFSEFVRVENLFDKSYVGSVKVNDSSSQYYEPGTDRNYLIGLNAAYSFK